MSYNRNSRREFLRKLACVACSGGTAAMIPQLRMIGSALANTKALTGYKALVCIYLAGGNDAWNLVVPFDNTRYNIYAAARSGVYTVGGANPNPGGLGLVQPSAGSAQIITDANDASSSTNQYFMHPNIPELAKLFQSNATPSLSKKLALIINAGTLVKPINKTDYNQSGANRPPQLFSHSDQENLWHQANTSGSSVQGWGGLCGDVLQPNNANQQLSSCISIAGANRFEVGMSTVPYQMSSGGLTALSGVCNPTPCGGVSTTSIRNGALNGLLGDAYANDFADEYGNVFKRGRDLYNLLSAGLTATTLTTPFLPSNNSLAAQLQMVARMIKLSKAQGFAQRQIYYVRYGGFDLHAGMMSGNGNHGQLLTAVSQAMNSFYKCLGADFGAAPGAQNEVTVFTASEFARTLQSNGSGSDHGWGGVQMVMGGAVNGGKLYSHGDMLSGFPNQNLTAPNNFSRGQMIPGIGVEQYAATLAQWMGVSLAQCNIIFPNLTNFTTKNLGFV